jgi:hypothetical protein
VKRVYWHAVGIAPANVTAMLLPLLVAVMAVLAQRLPVRLVPEETPVATVRPNVVYNGVGPSKGLSAHGAEWMSQQVRPAGRLPCLAVHRVVLTHFHPLF